jgi:hypothetical protein
MYFLFPKADGRRSIARCRIHAALPVSSVRNETFLAEFSNTEKESENYTVPCSCGTFCHSPSYSEDVRGSQSAGTWFEASPSFKYTSHTIYNTYII